MDIFRFKTAVNTSSEYFFFYEILAENVRTQTSKLVFFSDSCFFNNDIRIQ